MEKKNIGAKEKNPSLGVGDFPEKMVWLESRGMRQEKFPFFGGCSWFVVGKLGKKKGIWDDS